MVGVQGSRGGCLSKCVEYRTATVITKRRGESKAEDDDYLSRIATFTVDLRNPGKDECLGDNSLRSYAGYQRDELVLYRLAH